LNCFRAASSEFYGRRKEAQRAQIDCYDRQAFGDKSFSNRFDQQFLILPGGGSPDTDSTHRKAPESAAEIRLIIIGELYELLALVKKIWHTARNPIRASTDGSPGTKGCGLHFALAG
jgi:hypothetical protein